MNSTSFGSIVVALLIGGCSSLEQDGASSVDDLSIDPGDDYGTLALKAPPPSCSLPASACAAVDSPTITFDGAPAALDTTVRALAGNHTLVINGTSTTVSIDRGVTRTFVPGYLKISCSTAYTLVDNTDFGRVPVRRYGDCPTAPTTANGVAPTVALDWSRSQMVVPGVYTFSIVGEGGAVVTSSTTVSGGAPRYYSISRPVIGGAEPATFDTKLVFADPRLLPDAAQGTITSSCERNYTIPSNAHGTLSLHAYRYPECVYTLAVGGRSVVLDQGAFGANSFNLHRVDINDAVVAGERVRGTYEVLFAGQRVAGPFATGTGLDLLPGAYGVVVSWNTPTGPKSQTYAVNF